jgi:hypothetical protein
MVTLVIARPEKLSNHLCSPLPFVCLVLQQSPNRTNAMKRSERKTKIKRREPPEVNHATRGKTRERRRLLPIREPFSKSKPITRKKWSALSDTFG